MYIRFIDSQNNSTESVTVENKETDSIRKKQNAFQGLMSFAGTLPENFDYKKELEKAREAKYAHFI